MDSNLTWKWAQDWGAKNKARSWSLRGSRVYSVLWVLSEGRVLSSAGRSGIGGLCYGNEDPRLRRSLDRGLESRSETAGSGPCPLHYPL